MKITYPREKRKIRYTTSRPLYVILAGFYKGKELDFADFWEIPYTAKTYKEAQKLKKKIVQKAMKYGWDKNCFIIAKITL